MIEEWAFGKGGTCHTCVTHFGLQFTLHRKVEIGEFDWLPGDNKKTLICLSNRGDEHGMPARWHVTCPPEWTCTLAKSRQLVFAGEVEVSINDPFVDGYILQYHYERRGVPWIRREINRKLYLNEVYFDPERLRVDQRIIQELRENIRCPCTILDCTLTSPIYRCFDTFLA